MGRPAAPTTPAPTAGTPPPAMDILLLEISEKYTLLLETQEWGETLETLEKIQSRTGDDKGNLSYVIRLH